MRNLAFIISFEQIQVAPVGPRQYLEVIQCLGDLVDTFGWKVALLSKAV